MRSSWKKADAADTHKQTPTVSDWMIIVNRLCHCGSGGVGSGGDGLYCLVCVAAETRSVLSSQSK